MYQTIFLLLVYVYLFLSALVNYRLIKDNSGKDKTISTLRHTIELQRRYIRTLRAE